jgi:hypothetical protein
VVVVPVEEKVLDRLVLLVVEVLVDIYSHQDQLFHLDQIRLQLEAVAHQLHQAWVIMAVILHLTV